MGDNSLHLKPGISVKPSAKRSIKRTAERSVRETRELSHVDVSRVGNAKYTPIFTAGSTTRSIRAADTNTFALRSNNREIITADRPQHRVYVDSGRTSLFGVSDNLRTSNKFIDDGVNYNNGYTFAMPQNTGMDAMSAMMMLNQVGQMANGVVNSVRSSGDNTGFTPSEGSRGAGSSVSTSAQAKEKLGKIDGDINTAIGAISDAKLGDISQIKTDALSELAKHDIKLNIDLTKIKDVSVNAENVESSITELETQSTNVEGVLNSVTQGLARLNSEGPKVASELVSVEAQLTAERAKPADQQNTALIQELTQRKTDLEAKQKAISDAIPVLTDIKEKCLAAKVTLGEQVPKLKKLIEEKAQTIEKKNKLEQSENEQLDKLNSRAQELMSKISGADTTDKRGVKKVSKEISELKALGAQITSLKDIVAAHDEHKNEAGVQTASSLVEKIDSIVNWDKAAAPAAPAAEEQTPPNNQLQQLKAGKIKEIKIDDSTTITYANNKFMNGEAELTESQVLDLLKDNAGDNS